MCPMVKQEKETNKVGDRYEKDTKHYRNIGYAYVDFRFVDYKF